MPNNEQDKKHLSFELTEKSVDEENYTIDGVFSTADEDRHGEQVDQGGWDLKNYLKNPIVLFGHNSNQPPVGKMERIGYDDDGNLHGTIKFAVEEYPFAKTIFNLYAGGFMRAFSAGFINRDYEIEDGKTILKENELLEVSTVPIPANALALAKQKGIDTQPVEDMKDFDYTKAVEDITAAIEKEGTIDVEEITKARDALNDVLSSADKSGIEDASSEEDETPDAGQGGFKSLADKIEEAEGSVETRYLNQLARKCIDRKKKINS